MVAAATATGAAGESGHEHMHMAPAAPVSSGPYKRQVFDERQWKTVRVLCNLILPADERSVGATEAGVPEFLDDWLAFRAVEDGEDRLKAEILGGLTWMDRESNALFSSDFAEASIDQQKQLLDRIAYPGKSAKADHVWEVFFTTFRDLTVSGFFSSKVGVKDLPYLGNTVVPVWRGCDPKVWSVIEDRMQHGYKSILKKA